MKEKEEEVRRGGKERREERKLGYER